MKKPCVQCVDLRVASPRDATAEGLGIEPMSSSHSLVFHVAPRHCPRSLEYKLDPQPIIAALACRQARPRRTWFGGKGPRLPEAGPKGSVQLVDMGDTPGWLHFHLQLPDRYQET